MNESLPSALELLQSFLQADLVERNTEKALSFLSRHIFWYGTGENEDVHGIEEAKHYLETEMAANPPYQLCLEECSDDPASGTACIKCRVIGGGITLLCRCSAGTCIQDGAKKIAMLHMSVPDSVQQEDEFFPFSLAEQYERELYDDFLNDIVEGGIVGWYCGAGLPLYVVNRQMLEFLDYPSEAALRASIHGYAGNLLHPEDRFQVEQTIQTQLALEKHYRVEHRMLRRDGSSVWVANYGKQTVSKDGQTVVVGIIHDISAKREAEELADAKNREIRNLYDTIPGGVFLCKYNPDWDVTSANQGFYDFLGYSREEFAQQFHNKMIYVIHEDDRMPMVPILEAQLSSGNRIEHTNRLLCKDGVKWISIHAILSRGADDERYFYCTFVDVTAQKQAEQKLRDSEQRYRLAIEGAGVNVWEYEIPTHRLILPEGSKKARNGPPVIENFPESMMDQFGLPENQIDEMWDLFHRMERGEPKVSGDFWVTNAASRTRWCERVTYSVVFDEAHRPIRAYGASLDVTQSKLAEKRYHEELAYRDSVFKTIVATSCVNLTSGRVESVHFGKRQIPQAQYQPVLDFRRRSLLFLSEVSVSDEQNLRFSPEVLIHSYNDGVAILSEAFLAKVSEDRYAWIRAKANLVKHPESNDILAFFYYKDLTEAMIREGIMDTTFSKDYTELGIIDLRTGLYKRIASDRPGAEADKVFDYAAGLKRFCAGFVAEQDRRRIEQAAELPTVRGAVETTGCLRLSFLGLTSEGTQQFFELRFQYLGNNHDVLLMTRQNVDSLVKAEQIKQRQLEKAVAEASAANQVKSEFLSRMSHEIRTPLNAIIGLAELAMENLKGASPNPADGRDYVEKTLDASHYLLSIINDILDMSKIESGEIYLSCQPLDCQQILCSIDTMIRTQAEAKQVDFSVEQEPGCPVSVMGDETRVKQILVNLLNNAVKFTPAGGNVRLRIRVLSDCSDLITMQFEVSDTGVGISPDFLPRLFDPFTQEYGGPTTAYGGSGLGLAIARRLTRLMGGDLTVKSEKNVGSVFTAVMRFQHPGQQLPRAEAMQPILSRPNLKGRRILLCEDHPINTLVVQRLLERYGCVVDCAENGAAGVDAFRSSAPGGYDLILMDIRMPQMDGLTATKTIRALPRPDAKTTPILAMTANAYDEDIRSSMEAGMNAHLSKPIDADMLYRAIDTYCNPAVPEKP